MSLVPGTRLGPYEIQSAIGAGGMGEVYEARDTRLDRTVAIKVPPQEVSADPERRARWGQRLVQGQWPLLQTLRERLAGEVLHHEEHRSLVIADVVERADVRVVQAGNGLRLTLEARSQLLEESSDRAKVPSARC